MLENLSEPEHGYEKGTILEALKNVNIISFGRIIDILPQNEYYIVSSLEESEDGKCYVLQRYDFSRRKIDPDIQSAQLPKAFVEDKSVFHEVENPRYTKREREWFFALGMKREIPPNFIVSPNSGTRH